MSAKITHLPAGRSVAGRSRQPLGTALLGLAVALPACGWFWGFTVDDALITARVAAHCAQGLGPRFNSHGPVTDAVTPLGYAQALTLFSDGETWPTFIAAKYLGLSAWLGAAAVLGVLLGRTGQRGVRFSPLAIVAISAPLSAWAVSGMETGLVTLLSTVGLTGGSAGALALGLSAALRPELGPFAFVLVGGRLIASRARARALFPLALVLLPALVVAALRFYCFGRVVPLSFYAKPSDFEHGLRYALGACVFSGLPWLLLALPRTWSRIPARVWPLAVATLTHASSLVLCGGDWMPFYRLAVPVLPAVALLAAHLAEASRAKFTLLRVSLGSCAAAVLALGLGPAARHVGADRARLIAEARPVLAGDARVVALDVGWVGAATDADVIDLAGVTDPDVALFPGGHTSKRIPQAWLYARRPNAVVLLLARGATLELPFESSRFARVVEQRVAGQLASEFRVRATLSLADQHYVVLEPRP